MRRIGVMVDLIGQFGRGVLQGVSSFSLAHGQIHLITPQLYSFAEREEWDKWQLDGMVIQAYSRRIVEFFKQQSFPCVNVSTILSDSGLPSVSIDNVAVGNLAADYLLNRGFRNFAYFQGVARYAAERGTAFAQRVTESGYSCHRSSLNTSKAHHGSENRELLVKELRELPRPMGIFTANDPCAMFVLEACAEAGIAVPEHAAVLGCDNDELLFRRAHPPLSSILLPVEKIGFSAAQTLMELLGGKTVPPLQLLAPLSVVTRKSTDILAINDEAVAEALRFIRQHASDPITVDDVIARVPLSRRVLEQRFKEIVGRSPLAEIRRVQLETARKLLIETDLSMPQIATRCGFAGSSYFGIAFRKDLGVTPTEYRNAHRCRLPVKDVVLQSGS